MSRRKRLGNGAARDDVGDGEPSARLQHPERLAEHAILVGGQVDDAIGDDDVDRVVGQRDGLDLALEELDVVGARLALVVARQRQHLVGHVEAVGLALRADAARRQQHVDAAARAEIEHGLARFQLRQRGRIAAAERSENRLLRQRALLRLRVEIGRDRVLDAQRRLGAAAAGRNRSRRERRRRNDRGRLLECWLRTLRSPQLTGAGDRLGADRLVAGAALGEQEGDDLLQRRGVGGVAKERALAPHANEVFVLQLVEMMRQRRGRDAEFGADLADDQPFGMGLQQQPHDPQARLGAERAKHVGEVGDLFGLEGWHRLLFHISISVELSNVNAKWRRNAQAAEAWAFEGGAEWRGSA